MKRRLIAIVTACVFSGCSLFLTSEPQPPPSPPNCETVPIAPIIDGGVAYLSLMASGVAAMTTAFVGDRFAT